MRVLSAAAALATAVAWTPLAAYAFVYVPTATTRAPISSRASSSTEECATDACEIPEFGNTPSLVGVPNGANAIRSAVVTNAAGDFVRIDDAIQASSKAAASAPQIVVYLRHMG